jgi:Folate-sensitive fragile site protein Fra10Ac1
VTDICRLDTHNVHDIFTCASNSLNFVTEISSAPLEMGQPFHQSSRPSSAYTRHLQQVSSYLRYYGGSKPQPTNFRTERQLLEENHKFIRDDDDRVDRDATVEKEIARKYYDKLFREFALVELGRWKEGMVRCWPQMVPSTTIG